MPNPTDRTRSPSSSPKDKSSSPQPQPEPAPKKLTNREQVEALIGERTLFRLRNPGQVKLVTTSDGDFESQMLFRHLSPETVQRLSKPEKSSQLYPDARLPQFFTVDRETDGGTSIREFADLQSMLHHVREMDGTETDIVPVCGWLYPYSKKTDGDPRIIFAPDGTARLLDKRLTVVTELEATVSVQDDWYMGMLETDSVCHSGEDDVPPPPLTPESMRVEESLAFQEQRSRG